MKARRKPITQNQKAAMPHGSFIVKPKQLLISITPRDLSFIVEENLSGIFKLFAEHRVRIDLNKRTANILISKAEYARRKKALERQGGFKSPASQTPWQEIQRGMVEQLADGMVLMPAVKYQRVAQKGGVPRDNQ